MTRVSKGYISVRYYQCSPRVTLDEIRRGIYKNRKERN
jgi:hypothetical protein